MPSALQHVESRNQSILNIRVCPPNGVERTHELAEGHVLVIGSSPACGLRLDAPGIAGMHCTIEFSDAGITVRDWSTESGTYLDGSPIEERSIDKDQFELRISGILLVVRRVAVTEGSVRTAKSSGGKSNIKPSSDRPNDAPAERRVDEVLGQSAASSATALGIEEDSLSNLQHAADRDATSAPDDLADLADEGFEDHQSFQWDDSVESNPWTSVDPDPEERYWRSDLPEETTALLQIEVEFLRSELAERDARLQALEQVVGSCEDAASDTDADVITREEAESLLGRLEQLLEELDQSDARVKALNESWRTAEEALQAADEERRQMEGWMGEIDRRVVQWEEEWHAERDAMRRSIEELTHQRDAAEQRLSRSTTREQANSAAEQLIRELRAEQSSLRVQLESLTQERDGLRSRLEDVSVVEAEQRVAAAVDAALREERLQLAQEKAALARERSELARRQDEHQAQLERQPQNLDSADHRIRAFREHLRELQETEPQRARATTLSQRMGKLWRKLEGRPLDTD